MNKSDSKVKNYPAIIAIIMLLLAPLAWPYGYYMLLKWVVCSIAVYYAYTLYDAKKLTGWLWTLVIIAILFNPLVPIYLNDKGLWGSIDVVVAILFVGLVIITKKDTS
ncbi:MAG: DUF6804 family protein [Patescibacteria group bacterium]|jgi:hypothetical protein